MSYRSSSVNDRRTLYVTAFARAVTTSLIGVSLGVYLARAGLTGVEIGPILSAGLAGAASWALVATLFGDRIGRRRFLVAIALVSAAGTALFASVSHPLALAFAAFAGMVNAMGKDRGAALVLEQAAIPSTTTDAGRTRAIAWYTMLQDLGHALGALLAGAPALFVEHGAHDAAALQPTRVAFGACAVLGVVAAVLYARLSPLVDAGSSTVIARVSPRSRGILLRICALFTIDSLAGGFLTTALLSYFFFHRFGVSELVIGTLFFSARLMNAVSHLGAAWLAKRIGLVRTMVFTHIPSSVLLATVAFAPSFWIAAVLFLMREGLVEMDVPTRQSYVLAVVAPEERTMASGVTNLVRLAAWAVAPAFAGLMMTDESMHLPLVIGAAMKIAYDLLLWRAFRGVRPPEEMAASP